MSPSPRVRLPSFRRRDGGRFGAFVGFLAVVVVVALMGLTVAGRQVRAPAAPLAAAITFLPYVYAAVATALFTVWVLLPDRRALPVGLLTVLGVGAAIWGPRWGGDGPPVDGDEVRVVSWNLRRLWGLPADEGDSTSCAVAAIKQLEPDVLTLLEVSEDDVDRLKKALGLTCIQHSYLEKGGRRTGGLATCVRGDRWRLRSGASLRFVDHEDWYYVMSEVEHKGTVFNLLAVHLSPYEYVAKKIRVSVEKLSKGSPEGVVEFSREGEGIVRGQANQSAALLDRVDKFRDPSIVAGDFNSTRDAALHNSLRKRLKDTWEVAGVGFGGTVELFDFLPLRIDYIYATPEFRVARTEVPEVGCSDHRPVVADLVLARPEQARQERRD